MKITALKNTLSEVYERKTRCDLERALTLLTIIGIVALAVIGGLGLREVGELARLSKIGGYACLGGVGLIAAGIIVYYYRKSNESMAKKTGLSTENEHNARAYEVGKKVRATMIKVDRESGVAVFSRVPRSEAYLSKEPLYYVKPDSDQIHPLPKQGIKIDGCVFKSHANLMVPGAVSWGNNFEKSSKAFIKTMINLNFRPVDGKPKVAWFAPNLFIIVVKTTDGKWFYAHVSFPSIHTKVDFQPLPENGVTIASGGSIDKYGRIIGEKARFSVL